MKTTQGKDLQTIIENATHELDKACHILNYWQNQYLFNERPDPRAAVAWGNSPEPKTPHKEQSARWYFDYEEITSFINIASDYVFAVRSMLKETQEAEDFVNARFTNIREESGGCTVNHTSIFNYPGYSDAFQRRADTFNELSDLMEESSIPISMLREVEDAIVDAMKLEFKCHLENTIKDSLIPVYDGKQLADMIRNEQGRNI